VLAREGYLNNEIVLGVKSSYENMSFLGCKKYEENIP